MFKLEANDWDLLFLAAVIQYEPSSLIGARLSPDEHRIGMIVNYTDSQQLRPGDFVRPAGTGAWNFEKAMPGDPVVFPYLNSFPTLFLPTLIVVGLKGSLDIPTDSPWVKPLQKQQAQKLEKMFAMSSTTHPPEES